MSATLTRLARRSRRRKMTPTNPGPGEPPADVAEPFGEATPTDDELVDPKRVLHAGHERAVLHHAEVADAAERPAVGGSHFVRQEITRAHVDLEVACAPRSARGPIVHRRESADPRR